MIQTVEAVLDPSGTIRLSEPLNLTKPTRVLVTVLPDQETAPDLRDLYERAKQAVTTVELDTAAQEQGGRHWPDIRSRLGSP